MTISDLYDYPVSLSSEEFQNATGRSLSGDLEPVGTNDTDKVVNFLNTIHSHIYDYVIYNSGQKRIKDRIIKKYIDELEKPIKRALVMQGKYLLDNGSNIGTWNGIVNTVNGTSVTDTQSIINKVICPEAVNILLATEPNILFAGE